MKTSLFALSVLVILCSAVAFGQSALSNQPQVLHIPDHPMHAETRPMAIEHPLVGGGESTYTYAQGERPLWEFGPVSETQSTPLGDIARAFRREKQAAKKAEIVLEKQGS